ncbi:MAG: TIGR04211 family SH3 domain-containing protein [Deltaproteobacteria bacterium]|nr:TIGR04211 family SH3 domain-containing protein [Deltaproteobacteria bacterium]
MKAYTKFHFLIMIVLMAFMVIETGNAQAEIRFVSDLLVITLRSEPEKDAEVIRTLRSNTPLEVIEEYDEYLKVRTEKDEEGWIIKRYVTSNIPKPIIITELGERINELEEKNEELVKISENLEAELNEIKKYQNGSDEYKASIRKERKEAAKAIRKLDAITKKYNAFRDKSRNVIEMTEKIKKMEEKIVKLNSSKGTLKVLYEELKQEKKDLLHAGIIRWFLAGSGVLFAGMILGKISRKKDYY